MSKVINFVSEANKRNVEIKPVHEEIEEDSELYQGELTTDDDLITVVYDPLRNYIEVDVEDIKTNEVYAQYSFDRETLYLVMTAIQNLIKQVEHND